MSGARATADEIVCGRMRTRAPRWRMARTMLDFNPKSTIPISGPPSSARPTSMIDDGETWPTKSWSSQRGTARAAATAASRSIAPGAVTIAAHAAVRPQVTGKRAGVDAGDGRDVGIAQQRSQLARIVEHGRRRVGDDQRPQPRPDRLVVVDQAAVVADEGIGHDHDLAGVRGVGADLLVAGLAGVDDEVAAGRDRRAEGDPREDRPVLERQQRRTQVADPRIDDRARSGCRGHGSGDHVAPDTTNPPASRARWADACADIDASFAGLTGPVRQPHRTGHERTMSG